jgi:hypothetical protein
VIDDRNAFHISAPDARIDDHISADGTCSPAG